MASTLAEKNGHRHLYLEIGREAGELKIGLSEQHPGDLGTLQQIVTHHVSMAAVEQRSSRILDALNQANRSGRWTSRMLSELKDSGQYLRDALFSVQVKEKFDAACSPHLILTLDEDLVHLPWELLYNGRDFLCRQYAVGRIVRTRRTVYSSGERLLSNRLKMLILADPAGDLPSAHEEGVSLRNTIERRDDRLEVSFRSDNVTAAYLQTAIRHFDVIHFAGHGEYHPNDLQRTGWRLSRDLFTADSVIRMAGTGTMPSLVYANACQSACSNIFDPRDGFSFSPFGMAHAFIRSGVKHYLGAIWEIADASGCRFSEHFYAHLMAGQTIGRALQQARLSLIQYCGEENLNWAGYLLYGNPTSAYFSREESGDTDREENAAHAADDAIVENSHEIHFVRHPADVIHFSRSVAKARPRKRLIGLVAALLAVIAAGIWWHSHYSSKDTIHYEQQALTAFQNGDYATVIRMCEYLQQNASRRPLSYLLLGKVYFTQGRLENARVLFDGALANPVSNAVQKAEALIGLGRLASLSGQTDTALEYYRQAADVSPSNEQPYLAQAILLERKGDLNQAGQILEKARTVSADPRLINALRTQIHARSEMADDQQRMARVDHLINELDEKMENRISPHTMVVEDDWTSRPLTLWLMEFDVIGYDLLEGQGVLLTSALTDVLMKNRRLTLVERTKLDKILAEMKLGASQAADPQFLLRLGRITAARLIVSGRLVNLNNEDQVAMRCIEVETGEVKAVIQTSFSQDKSLPDMAGFLAQELYIRLAEQYPLRARVLEFLGEHWRLNIGRRQGAFIGLRMRGLDSDLIVEVVSVDNEQCQVQIKRGGPMEKGLRLEAILS